MRETRRHVLYHPFVNKWLDVLAFDDLIGTTFAGNHFWETGALKDILSYMPATPHKDFTVVDCGANVGNHTLFLGSFGFEVQAFEGFPDTYEVLRMNMEKNHIRGQAHLALLSDQVETRHAVVCKNNLGGTNFLTKGEAQERAGSAEEGVEFETVTLDSYNLPRCDLLKVDVEGAELRLLEGAKDLLKRTPLVCVEAHNPPVSRSDIHAFFKRISFKGEYHITGSP